MSEKEFLLTDFQQMTADRIANLLCHDQKRVLLADEVGLGKTIVAREVIRRVSKYHKEHGDDHFKVVYICSNINIASQNMQKLGIKDQMNVAESRLSMQHLKIYQSAGTGHDYEQLIPMTPATSFSINGGKGIQSERALMYALLRRLPVFADYQEELGTFMAVDAEVHWHSYVSDYESKVLACDRNGSHYLEDMITTLSHKLLEQENLVSAIIENCISKEPDRIQESKPLISRLRRIFAEISLKRLDPDLVIMDEFQRFRTLITPAAESEEKLLSQQFLHDPNLKVLLLSATPYKQYSTLEEIAEDEESDHFHEFEQVMDFLLADESKRHSFHKKWQDYSSSLCEISTDSMAILVTKKKQAEDELYQGICRTERFNTGIIDDSGAKEVEIGMGDILSYDAMQKLLDAIAAVNPKTIRWRNVPVDYIKSAPYLLSFMESYQLKKYIKDYCAYHPEFSVKDKADEQYLLLRKSAIHNYRLIPSNNARLETLRDILFSNGKLGSETLLWVPASRPYYQTGGVFAQNKDFSKVLVFSSWEMVPRMISVMLSYEAERLTIGKLFNSAKERRGRGYFTGEDDQGNKQNKKRRFGTSRLIRESEDIVCLVSDTLADLYRPQENLNRKLTSIRREIKVALRPVVEDLKKSRGLRFNKHAGAADLIECIKAIDGDPKASPVRVPNNIVDCMAEMAIGSPAICAYRLLCKDPSYDKKSAAVAAAEIAKKVFVSLFNKAESSAILDLLYTPDKADEAGREEAYYQDVFRYCAEGNLQAVLDEYAHTLGVKGDALKNAIIEGVADTVSLQIDMQETFPNKKRAKMRSHYAVGYYNAKTTDEAVARADLMRKAFNSPFRPFVLSTTSIGQEGLDFHYYCRKVMHWNLPANPIDLEQREGRINRYKCLAVRQNIARKYKDEPNWDAMFEHAAKDMKGNYPDLVPYWCLPNPEENPVRIERIVPMYPFSQDRIRYERIRKILNLYRLTLGQPRQEELITILDKAITDDQSRELFMNLSPFYHDKKGE